MRIVAATFGTEGDWRPLAALCRGLIDAGHDAQLLTEAAARDYAAALRVPFVPLAGDMAADLRNALPTLGRRDTDVDAAARVLGGMASRNTSEWMKTVLDHAHGADAIVCAGLAVYVGLSCAEKLGIQAIGAALQPVMPTREFPSPFLPPLRLPGFLNRLTHRIVLAGMWRHFQPAINAAREAVAQQPPREREWSDYPVLFGMSPTLVPQPRDWPERFEVVGYWWGPVLEAAPVEPALDAFLAGGEPPIYIGFGSMLGFDVERTEAIVLDALRGRRALLGSGWGGLGSQPLPPSALRIGHVPHEWLFPQVRAVVHHGGAGTSHAAARAGVPSVVLPFGADQRFWGERLRRAGIAPPPVRQQRVDAKSLGDAIEAASSDAMRNRAREVAAAMVREDGVNAAVRAIERIVPRARRA